MMELLREFKPALLFLAKFLGIYFAGNILYGVFIESFQQKADPVTYAVASQTTVLVNWVGYDVTSGNVIGAPKVAMRDGARDILHVFEGCNGLNVMIVFVAFLFAFGGPPRALLVFLPAGLLVIHLFNLLRLALLYHLALHDSEQFYYFHKYFFTAFLYGVVFLLWALWVIRFNEKRRIRAAA